MKKLDYVTKYGKYGQVIYEFLKEFNKKRVSYLCIEKEGDKFIVRNRNSDDPQFWGEYVFGQKRHIFNDYKCILDVFRNNYEKSLVIYYIITGDKNSKNELLDMYKDNKRSYIECLLYNLHTFR